MSDESAPPQGDSCRVRVHAAASRHPIAMIVAGAALYSIGPVLVAASTVSGSVFSFWRLWLGVLVFGVATAVWWLTGGRVADRQAWRWALFAGLCFGIHQVLFMTAIKLTSVTTVTLIGTISPIVVAVAAVPLFGERMGRPFRVWTLAAMAGAAIVVLGASSGPTGDVMGTTMAVTNVFLFSGFFLLSKISRDHLPVLPFLFGVITIAALAVSVFTLATGAPVGRISRVDLIYAFALAAGPGALGHFVMTWPLRFVAANVPPVIRLAQPVVSGTLAWIFLAQPVGLWHVAGGTLTLAGVAGAMLSPTGQRVSTTVHDEGDAAPDLPG